MPQRGNDRFIAAQLRAHGAALPELVLGALDATGFEVVDVARSLTAQMRPPVRPGEGPRAAHPGGWADVTGVTAGSMRHTVEQHGRARFALTLEAGGAARYLERRGYWVFSGLFEGTIQSTITRNLDAVLS